MLIVSMLIQLAIVGGIVYAIVQAVQRGRRHQITGGDTMATRRLFQYAMLFAALVVAAIGLAGLVERLLATTAVRSDTRLATILALTFVGLPVFAGLGRWAWRRLRATSAEREALGWSLYLNGALVTSLAVAAANLLTVLTGWIDGSGLDPEAAARAIVWGAVWAGHWYAWREVAPRVGAHLHLLAGSGIGLGMLAAGSGTVVSRLVEMWFDAAGSDVVARPGSDALLTSAAIAGVGAAVWSWHWLGHSRRMERSGIWLVYVLLYGVLGGLAATLVGAGRAVFLGLEWLWGDPATASAAVHFRQLGPALGALLVGMVAWRYHRTVVGPQADRARGDVDRVYDAIVAGTALATVAAAVAVLVVALFRLASPAAVTGEPGGDVLLAAVTLLLVGGPLWSLTWARMQRYAHAGTEETSSTPRRSYLFAILGASGAIAFGAAIRLLVVVFETILGERTGSLSGPLEWPVALLVTTGAVAGYHFVVARAERPERETRPHRDVLLVWSGNGEARALAELTHTSVRVLRRTDQEEGPIDVAAVAAAIDAADGEHLMVVAGPDGVQVIPYE